MPQESSDRSPKQIVLVTGMSGAGRTTALKALEDLGHVADGGRRVGEL